MLEWDFGGLLQKGVGGCNGTDLLKIDQASAIPVGAGLPAMRPVQAEFISGTIAGKPAPTG